MEVSVVIPCHRGGEKLKRLLPSLAAQASAPSFEVIVVANPPDEKQRALAEKHERIRYLETKTLGANSARNLGVAHAKGEIVLFLDDDCVVSDPLFLRRHLDGHRAQPGVSGLGGRYECPASATAPARAYHRRQEKWLRFGLSPGYHADLLIGGNMSFKREALGIKPFNEMLAYGGTETELIFRLASAGHRTKLIEPLSVEHQAGDLGFFSFLRKAAQQGRGAGFLARKKHYGLPKVTRPDEGKTAGALDFLYECFFQAGYQVGRVADRPVLFFPLVIPVAAVFSLHPLWKAWTTVRHRVVVEAWCSLEAAMLVRRGKRKNSHRS